MLPLSSEQKRDVCTIAAVGCDRHIAARYLGCRPEELKAEIEADAAFARDLAQAEARAELTHVRNVQQAAQDDKHWRASVWWLERRAPERYGRRDAGAMSAIQVERFVKQVAQIIAEDVRHEEDRDRLMLRLDELASDVIHGLGERSQDNTPNATEEREDDLEAGT